MGKTATRGDVVRCSRAKRVRSNQVWNVGTFDHFEEKNRVGVAHMFSTHGIVEEKRLDLRSFELLAVFIDLWGMGEFLVAFVLPTPTPVFGNAWCS